MDRIFKEDEPVIRVCPYQQAGCVIDRAVDCVLAVKLRLITSLAEWEAKAKTASSCRYRGTDLTEAQYNNKKLGLLA